MKKAVLVIIMSIGIFSFQDGDKLPVKKFKLELTLEEANALLYLVDNARADNLLVKEMKELMMKQFKEQQKADTIKPKK